MKMRFFSLICVCLLQLTVGFMLKNSDVLNKNKETATQIEKMVKLYSKKAPPNTTNTTRKNDSIVKLNGYRSSIQQQYSSYNYNTYNSQFGTSLTCIVSTADVAG